MKFLKGRRTQIVGTIIAILGLFETYAREMIPADWQGWSLFAAGILMVLLRQITTTPVGEKE